MSLLDPLCCGFAKAIGYNILQDKFGLKKTSNESPAMFTSRLFEQQYKAYNDIFVDGGDFQVTYLKFRTNFSLITPYFKTLSKRQSKLKHEFLKVSRNKKYEYRTEVGITAGIRRRIICQRSYN